MSFRSWSRSAWRRSPAAFRLQDLRCGIVNVNEAPGYRSELTAFGGIKASGLGAKEGVIAAIRGITNVKLFTLP
jgi:aldehyde dehydrogenase (NAD+)